jgi:hypothetical protein
MIVIATLEVARLSASQIPYAKAVLGDPSSIKVGFFAFDGSAVVAGERPSVRRPAKLRPVDLGPIEPPPNQKHLFWASGVLCCFQQPFADFGRALCGSGMLTAGGAGAYGMRLDRSRAIVHGALPGWELRNLVAAFSRSK